MKYLRFETFLKLEERFILSATVREITETEFYQPEDFPLKIV